jgi:hypothetical protein
MGIARDTEWSQYLGGAANDFGSGVGVASRPRVRAAVIVREDETSATEIPYITSLLELNL